MKKIRKKRGRPLSVGSLDSTITLRISSELIKNLDDCRRHREENPARAEMIRIFLRESTEADIQRRKDSK